MSKTVLQTSNLVCGYVSHSPLFEPLSLNLRQGEITAILGGNGQGKTTLMHTLIGQQKALSGRIKCDGHLNFVPQRFSAAFSYPVLEMVLMGRANRIGLFSQPGKEDHRMAMAALTSLSIQHLAERAFNTLSGGQQQLVLIARALATDCKVLILDEPTTALDLSYQATVIQLLYRLAKEQGIAVFFSTHDPAQAQLIADDVLMLMKDKHYFYGAKADILTETNLTNLYGVPIQRCDMYNEQQRFTTFVPFWGQLTEFSSM